MLDLEVLFREIESHHKWEPCEDPAYIDNFVINRKLSFPADLIQFYSRYKCVALINIDNETLYRFVPIHEIHPTRIDIYGRNTDEWGPANWLTVCDVLDGNYIAIDINSGDGNNYNFIYCFHETFARSGESPVIAKSFTELLHNSLQSPEICFFDKDDFRSYGDGLNLISISNSIKRIENPEICENGWLVNFEFPRINEVIHKFFPDTGYGTREESYIAAIKYFIKILDELNARIT